jgi:hypothetical protein
MLDRTSVVSLVRCLSIRSTEKSYVLRNRSNGQHPKCHGRMSKNTGCRRSSGWPQEDEVSDKVIWHSDPHGDKRVSAHVLLQQSRDYASQILRVLFRQYQLRRSLSARLELPCRPSTVQKSPRRQQVRPVFHCYSGWVASFSHLLEGHHLVSKAAKTVHVRLGVVRLTILNLL